MTTEKKIFVCNGKRPDNEVIQEAIDWADKGTEEKPRLAFVKKRAELVNKHRQGG